jgi:hypothetical protein
MGKGISRLQICLSEMGAYGCIDLEGKKYFGFYSSANVNYPTLLKRSADIPVMCRANAIIMII